MIKYSLSSILSIILTFLFLGCDSSSYSTTSEPLQTNALQSSNITGRLADGYISGSTLCLDKDLDGECDLNISKTTSNNDGIFKFSNINDINQTNFINIIATGGIDTSTQKSFIGSLKNTIQTNESNKNIIISPLTDLVSVAFLNADVQDIFTLNYAKDLVASTLGIDTQDIYKDPMKDITIFSKSQEIQHTKQLLQTAFEKRTSIESKIVEEKIKATLITYELNIAQTLITLEINLNTKIPENEKQFIKNQIIELKQALNALSQDTSLDIENLNRLQESIDKEQTNANTKLLEADENTTLEVVKITATKESITQSMFDTQDAILDEQACKKTDNFNLLETNNFTIGENKDTTNGIEITSNFERGEKIEDSLVKIYYPSLQSTKIDNDDIVVFQDNYYFSFNKAYNNNPEKTVYIMTPKGENDTYSCYRFVLNFSVATNVKGTKVFRYEDI